MSKSWKRIVRPATAEERQRHGEIREQVVEEFPPPDPPRFGPVGEGLAAQIRAARQAQGLTRVAVAHKAGLADSTVVRDVEYGRDAKLSDVRAIAAALGLELVLVETMPPSP